MRNKKRKGLTMMELIVVIGIMGVVVTAASSALLQGFQMYSTSRQMERGQNEARDVLMVMGRDAQRVSQVVTARHNLLRMVVGVNDYRYILEYRAEDGFLQRNWYRVVTDDVHIAEITADTIPATIATTPTSIPPWSVPFSGANIDSFYSQVASTRTGAQARCPVSHDAGECDIYCPENDVLVIYVASSGISEDVTGTDFSIADQNHRRTASNVFTNRISLNRTPPAQ